MKRQFKNGDSKAWIGFLRRELLSPATGLYVFTGITANCWISYVSYLGLKSFLFDPNGILVWSFIACAGAAFALIVALYVRHVTMLQNSMRAARKRFDDHEPGSESDLRDAMTPLREGMSLQPMLIAFILFVLIGASCVPLTIWREMQTPLVQSPKHPRAYSPREELEKTLASIERDGVLSIGQPNQVAN